MRERGCISFAAGPAPGAYWSSYFTDDELLHENAKGDVDRRIKSCENAIDRWVAGQLVYAGPWYQRGLTL